jgi:hypothetical protein
MERPFTGIDRICQHNLEFLHRGSAFAMFLLWQRSASIFWTDEDSPKNHQGVKRVDSQSDEILILRANLCREKDFRGYSSVGRASRSQ